MIKYDTGSLIKRLRRQKSITQEQLAEYAGIDRATLSKIENGKAAANNSTLHIIFQKLGLDPASLSGYFLSGKEVEWEVARTEIEANASHRDYDKVYALLEKLENDADYMKHNNNRQFVAYIRGFSHLFTGKSPDEALEILDKAIKITLPHFSPQYLDDYHLSSTEFNICSSMALAYSISGRQDEAIELMFALKDNFDNNCIDRNLWGKQYPTIIYHLTRFLCLAERFEEALELCEIGRKAAASGYTSLLPQIILNKAYCLNALGDKAGSEQTFRNVYHTYLLYEMPGNAEAVKRDAKKYLDVDL